MSFDLKIVSGDFIISNGDLATVSNQEKLIQDILKICLTPAGANFFQPWYGSYISQTLIGSYLESGITVEMAQNQLQNSIENLKKLQQLQINNVLQQITPDEHIAGVKGINVIRSNIDPRAFEVTVQVLSKTFKEAMVNFPVSNIG